jgi:putative transposase
MPHPMSYNPNLHHRRSIRLKNYDYRQAGAYFITICIHQRQCRLGQIQAREMAPTIDGTIVAQIWHRIPQHFANAHLDAFVVMPNHIHGILWLGDDRSIAEIPVGAKHSGDKSCVTPRINLPNASPLPPHGTNPGSINAIVQNFKSISTRKINQIHKTPGSRIWQRDYYEHIIRDEIALDRIRTYIQNNPRSWHTDRHHPNPPIPNAVLQSSAFP